MTGTNTKRIRLPESLLDLPEKDRREILDVLKEASKLPKVRKIAQTDGDEHNLWARNGDPFLADAEDDLYQDLIQPWAQNMADLFIGLGLPSDKLKKAHDPSFNAFEAELQKASGGKSRIPNLQDLIKANKRRRKQFMKWIEDGKAMTQKQLEKLDEFLRRDLPNYAKKAEEFMVRAGFIGKIRNRTERENFETLGTYIDRIPQSIEAAVKEGVVLTLREKTRTKRRGKKVEILPLTTQEAEAVRLAAQHAGEKMTEIAEREIAGVRQLVIQAKRERWSAQKLAQALFDKFGDHNRDWRRVAITELAFATNDAYLSGLDEGDRVVGMGAANACKHCQKLVIGKEFILTKNPPKRDTYESDMKYVWPGKSNYGRRVPEWRPCIPLHPNCRCRWHRVSRFYTVTDKGTFRRKTTEELIQEELKRRGLPPDPHIEEKLRRIRQGK